MKKIKKVLKKGFFVFLLSVFAFQPFFIYAATPITYTSTDPEKLGAPHYISPGNSSTEGAAMSNKAAIPKIKVIFDKNPVNGEKITATAIQTGFNITKPKDIYYTWYIKHKGGSNSVEDWKKDAAGIIARGDFELKDLKPGSGDEDQKGYSADPDWSDPSFESKNCYMASATTGRIYELSANKETMNCPDKTTAICAKSKILEEGQYQGNYPPNLTPGTYPDASPAESSCTFQNPSCAMGRSDCNSAIIGGILNPGYSPDYVSKKVDFCTSGPTPKCETVDNENFKTKVTCSEAGYEPKCIKQYFSTSATQANVCNGFGVSKTSYNCEDKGTPDSNWQPAVLYNFQKDPSPYLDSLGKTVEDPNGVQCIKTRVKSLCKHLFPKSAAGERLGDGKYTSEEETYWKTNPNAISTSGDGKNDEANLMGLNIEKFTWVYQDGDQIGVAVEGALGNPTKHDDASYMITWAFSNNTCSKFEDYLKTVTGDNISKSQFYMEQSNTASSAESTGTGIIIINPSENQFTINDCLEENLIDPVGGSAGELDLKLEYKPATPKNIKKDQYGNSDGDIVKVLATINNANGSVLDYSYKWSIETSSDGTVMPESWITVPDLKNYLTLKSAENGIGNNEFSFKLDISGENLTKLFGNKNEAYIRIKAETKETSGGLRSGKGVIVIKITNTANSIIPYTTKIEADVPKIDTTNRLCGEAPGETPCSNAVIPVLKNEIIGLKMLDETNINQIVWKKDGSIITCDEKISANCGMGQIIPITGTEGTIFEVSAALKPKTVDSSNTAQEFTRKFIIAKPSVKVSSVNEATAWKKIIKYATNLTGGEDYPVFSEQILKAYFGGKIVLRADFYPSFIKKDATLDWQKNGQPVSADAIDAEKNMSFVPIEEDGWIYSIGLKAKYSQPLNKRAALQNIWGISSFDSREKIFNTQIQVEATKEEIPLDDPTQTSFVLNKFFASLISNVSTQTMFILRVMLSIGIMFGFTWVIFAIIPAPENFKRRDF